MLLVWFSSDVAAFIPIFIWFQSTSFLLLIRVCLNKFIQASWVCICLPLVLIVVGEELVLILQRRHRSSLTRCFLCPLHLISLFPQFFKQLHYLCDIITARMQRDDGMSSYCNHLRCIHCPQVNSVSLILRLPSWWEGGQTFCNH